MASPSIFVTAAVATKAQILIRQGTGNSCREGVELVLKNDLSIGINNTNEPGNSTDAGSLVQKGLKVLSDDPYAALGVSRGDDLTAVRKAYKKMALKYHPDKSPTTVPLFQTISAAYEKVSAAAPANGDASHSNSGASHHPYPKSPSKTTPPSAPRPASYPPPPPPPSSSTGSSQPGPGRAPYGGSSAGYGSSNASSFAGRNSNAYYKDTASSASSAFNQAQKEARDREWAREKEARRRRQEEWDQAQAEEEEEREARRKREFDAAAARSSQRRAGAGTSTGSGYRPSPSDAPPPPPRPSDWHPNQRADNSSYTQQYPFSNATSGHSNSQGKYEPSRESTNSKFVNTGGIPTPTGVKAAAIDPSTAEIHWDTPPVYDTIGNMYRVELSWQGPNAAYGVWETAPKLISGDRVRKKNLEINKSAYKFRIRFVRGEGGVKGPYCRSESVLLPRDIPGAKPARTHTPPAPNAPPPPPASNTSSFRPGQTGSNYSAPKTTHAGTDHQSHGQNEKQSNFNKYDISSSSSSDENDEEAFVHPSELRATAIDPTSVELQWNLPGSAKNVGGVEISWHLMYAGSLEWELGDKVIQGNIVRKKNLVPGGQYKFRVRVVRSSGMRGSWCKAFMLKLPDIDSSASAAPPSKPESTDDTMPPQPHPTCAENTVPTANAASTKDKAASTKDKAASTKDKAASTKDKAASSEVGPIDPPAYAPPSYIHVPPPPVPSHMEQDTVAAVNNKARPTSQAEAIHRDDHSTVKPPPVPSAVEELSPPPFETYKKPYSSPSAAVDGSAATPTADSEGDILDMPEEEDFTGVEKIFKLHVYPSSRNGSALHDDVKEFRHSVHASASDKSLVLGYVTPGRSIFVRLRQGNWLYAQTHVSANARNVKRPSSFVEPQWGWVRISKAFADGHEEAIMRQVPAPADGKISGGSRTAHMHTDKVHAETNDDGCSSSSSDAPDTPSEDERSEVEEDIPLWYEQQDDSGYTYYYNEGTGGSEWYPPEWVEEIDPETEASYYLRLNPEDGSTLSSTWSKPKRFARLVRLEQQQSAGDVDVAAST